MTQLAKENHSPVGLAKCTTLRSFLSQWSYEDSQADGPESIRKVRVPVLVVANGDDHLVPIDHAEQFYSAVQHQNKEFHVIEGASHYYFGQPELMTKAILYVIQFLVSQKLLDQKNTIQAQL